MIFTRAFYCVPSLLFSQWVLAGSRQQKYQCDSYINCFTSAQGLPVRFSPGLQSELDLNSLRHTTMSYFQPTNMRELYSKYYFHQQCLVTDAKSFSSLRLFRRWLYVVIYEIISLEVINRLLTSLCASACFTEVLMLGCFDDFFYYITPQRNSKLRKISIIHNIYQHKFPSTKHSSLIMNSLYFWIEMTEESDFWANFSP